MEDKIIAAFSWKKYRPENCWATSFLEKGFRKQNSHLQIAFPIKIFSPLKAK